MTKLYILMIFGLLSAVWYLLSPAEKIPPVQSIGRGENKKEEK